jgi:hypothetical protein
MPCSARSRGEVSDHPFEAQQGFPFKAQFMTLCGYAVDCEDLADLTDPGDRAEGEAGVFLLELLNN